MANLAWWVLVPPGEANVTPRPADAIVVSTPVGSAQYNAWLGNSTAPVTIGGRQYELYMGPFASQAEAQSAQSGPANDTIAGIGAGAALGLGNESPSAAVATGQAAQNAAGKVTGWVHNIEQWLIRGFEMLLGAGLIIVALAKLAGDTPIGRTAIKAGKAAAIL